MSRFEKLMFKKEPKIKKQINIQIQDNLYYNSYL